MITQLYDLQHHIFSRIKFYREPIYCVNISVINTMLILIINTGSRQKIIIDTLPAALYILDVFCSINYIFKFLRAYEVSKTGNVP